jgi:hypothetical protein
MAKIVGIHGIAQQYQSGPELTETWRNALRGGMEEAGFGAKAETVQSGDVRVAFFGALFRKVGTMGAGTAEASLDDLAEDVPLAEVPKYTGDDLDPGPERDLLTALYEAAARADPSLPPSQDEMGVLAQRMQDLLRRLAKSQALAGIVERVFVRDVKQVNWYLDDADTKEEVLGRVDRAVGPDTRILVGHSLGSVVAYEYLCKYQPKGPDGVRLLVTVGSPLGIPNLVFDRLTPRPDVHGGAWPGSVGRWLNVADPNDVVPLVKELASLFPGPDGRRVDDRLVDNGEQPHVINRYLNSREVGWALGQAL